MEILGMILMELGVIVMVVGGIWFLIVAFQESALWGLSCVFVPFAALIFLVTHLDDAGKPFLIQLAGSVPMIIGMLMMGPQA